MNANDLRPVMLAGDDNEPWLFAVTRGGGCRWFCMYPSGEWGEAWRDHDDILAGADPTCGWDHFPWTTDEDVARRLPGLVPELAGSPRPSEVYWEAEREHARIMSREDVERMERECEARFGQAASPSVAKKTAEQPPHDAGPLGAELAP